MGEINAGIRRGWVMSFAIFLTFERNLWVSMIGMLALLGLLVSWPERFRILKWVPIGVFAAVLLFGLSGGSAVKYLVAGGDRLFRGTEAAALGRDSSIEWRIMETKYVIESILRNPLLGIGLANFYRPMIEDETDRVPGRPTFGMLWYVHNAYLWVWVDMGFFRLIPFLIKFLYRLLPKECKTDKLAKRIVE